MKLLVALVMMTCAVARAQIVSRDSLHLKPVGTKVSGSFVLVNRVIPLPEGQFVLAVAQVRGGKFVSGDYARQEHQLVDVILGQIVDGRLRAALGATALLASRGNQRWTDDPCKRSDTLFKMSRVPFMKTSYEQNCLLVNHLVNTLGSQATGNYLTFAGWIRENGGSTPIATAIQVSITRIAVVDYLVVHYFFNPEAYGCDPAPTQSWAASAWHKSQIDKDKEKSQFVGSAVEFGKAMQIRIGEAFDGRVQVAQSLATTTPSLYRCGVGILAAPPPEPAKSGTVSDRLKTLEGLKDQGLVSPAEYEERRRKILDSL